jgi:hypothetical protein
VSLAAASAAYAAVLLGALSLGWLGRRLRIPPPVLGLLAGLALGRAGFGVVDAAVLPDLLRILLLHVAVIFGALGVAEGQGFLRLPLPEILRRGARPVALGAFALLVGTAVLPHLLPDLEPARSFRRFLLPLAVTLAAFPLLAIRDLRGRPGRDAGAMFLVASAFVGAVYSVAPMLLWRPHLLAKVLGKEPTLVLGESGAFGVAAGVLYLAITRRVLGRLAPRPAAAPAGLGAPAPRRVGRASLLLGTILFLVLMERSWRYLLWPPFAALGFGAVLGRAGEPRLPLAGAEGAWVYSELPFVLLMGLAFAPDLWVQSLVGPSLLHAAYLGALLLLARTRTKEGRQLATGPGLLFLGLALTVRLDRRMGPLMGATVDFALPAWALLRAAQAAPEVRRRLRAAKASRASEA